MPLSRDCVLHVDGYGLLWCRRLTTTGTELYDTLATFRVRQCGGNPMVSPNNPAQSALLMVTNGKCGGLRMPQGCSGTSCVTSQEQQTISGWIAEGAKH